jgi:transmembrane sensor
MNKKGNTDMPADPGTVDDQAAGWISRLDRADASDEDREAFAAWRSLSSHNQMAVDRLSALWSDLDALRAMAHSNDSSVDFKTRRHILQAHGPSNRSTLMLVGAAASLAICTFVSLTLYRTKTVDRGTEVYATAIGEQRAIALEDGSSIQLNTNSRLEVHFTPERRDLRLLQGEAYFEVAPNKNRPFSVYAGEDVARAIGTAFVVRLREQEMEVTVTKGTVDVARLEGSTKSRQLSSTVQLPRRSLSVISASQASAPEAAVVNNGQITRQTLEPSDAARRLAWRQGVLDFSGETLPEAVADVSRYTDVQIDIADPRLADVRIGGYFKIGEVEPMLQALEASFGVKVDRLDAKHIRLTAAP